MYILCMYVIIDIMILRHDIVDTIIMCMRKDINVFFYFEGINTIKQLYKTRW